MAVTEKQRTRLFDAIVVGCTVALLVGMLGGGMTLWQDSYAADGKHDEQILSMKDRQTREFLEAAKHRSELDIRYRQDLAEIRATQIEQMKILMDIQRRLPK